MIEPRNSIWRRDKDFNYVFLLLLLAFLTRGAWMLLTENVFDAGDNFDRVVGAYRLFQNPEFIPSVDWLFGHFWMLFFPMWIFDDFNFAPRLLGFISGSLLPWPIFYLSKKLFGQKSAIISCLIYIFALPQILLSGSTLTAIPFSFFIFMGIYFFIEYQLKGNRRNIWGAAIFFMLANTLRQEAWIYSFAIGLYLLWKEKVINIKILIYTSLTAAPVLILCVIIIFKRETLCFHLHSLTFRLGLNIAYAPEVCFIESSQPFSLLVA